MNQILNKNLILIEKFQPKLHNRIKAYLRGEITRESSPIDRILLAKQEDMVLNMLIVSKSREYLLCDHEDPVGQAYGWIDKYINPANKAEIIFGLGFGFHIEVLLSSFQNKKIIIIEPNMELFYQILQVRNLESIIKNTILLVEEETETILNTVLPQYWDTREGGIQCQPFGIYSEIFESKWSDLSNRFIKQAQSIKVDLSTKVASGRIWAENYIINLQSISKASNAAGLAGSFSGKPGILVSAGPSLEKNMHLLKGLKDRCVIIAAGTAARILFQNGIIPHFMVGIDAWETEAEVHKKVKTNDIYFIYSNQVAAGSLQYYQGPKFLMSYASDAYTTAFFNFAGVKSQCFESAPSVSNTCFDILYKMGCNPIVLIGQDLAYTNGVLYADESPQNDISKDGWSDGKGLILTKDIYGQDIYTKLGFIAIKNYFESYFEKIQGRVEIINATEGGLNIDFTRNDILKNVIDKYCVNAYKIEDHIREIHKSSQFDINIMDKVHEYNQFILDEIQALSEAGKKQLKLVDLINRDFYHPAKDKKAFDKIVGRISEFTNQITGSPIYHPLLKNLVEMEFYLLKMELDRATSQYQRYEDIKSFYVRVLSEQNRILNEKLSIIRTMINNTELKN